MTELPKSAYATFNMRMLAAAVDLFLVTIVSEPITQWLMQSIFPPLDVGALSAKLQADMGNTSLMLSDFWHIVTEKQIVQRLLVENLPQLMLLALYTLPFWIFYSSSPGKMLLGLTIRDEKTLGVMTQRQCFMRFLGYFAAGIPLTLGFAWILFTRKRQGWQDSIAHTVVVRRKALAGTGLMSGMP